MANMNLLTERALAINNVFFLIVLSEDWVGPLNMPECQGTQCRHMARLEVLAAKEGGYGFGS